MISAIQGQIADLEADLDACKQVFVFRKPDQESIAEKVDGLREKLTAARESVEGLYADLSFEQMGEVIALERSLFACKRRCRAFEMMKSHGYLEGAQEIAETINELMKWLLNSSENDQVKRTAVLLEKASIHRSARHSLPCRGRPCARPRGLY